NTTMEFIKKFGFASGRDADKFLGLKVLDDANNNPFILEYSVADFTCEVKEIQDVGSHLLMIANVVDASKNSDDEVLTYSYYQKYLKGSTPKNAVSYQEKTLGYTCEICGYTYEGEELPEGFVCPVCGAPITMMKKNN
ncbi:MAG: flavin reductase, partial [Bacilli bacterium]|nr:flavin reductase [Bacilli bacterium]